MAGNHSTNGLNVELNLVPFIDLLSALVLFLLLSAVWIQISAIQAGVDSKGKKSAAQGTPVNDRLNIVVNAKGIDLEWPRQFAKAFPNKLPKEMNQYPYKALTSL